MNECSREQESLDHVRAGRWPHGCDEETRTHVASCHPCTLSVQLATLIAADHHTALRQARVPSSGLVWWRAQRRARQDAARAAARAVTIVQGVSVVAGVGAAIALAGADELRQAITYASTQVVSLGLPLAVAITASIALAPVAVYFAVGRD